jgi:hypothetical protein
VLSTIRAGLAKSHDSKLVDELIEAYVEAKRNYYLGGLRLSAVEGGRFCEAAYRILEERATKKYLPLGRQLDTEKLTHTLATLPAAAQPDAVRIHIPRALRVVYDIRNKRDAAHLADGIDPNLQDATLVVSIVDWVLAEFVRLYHNVPANDAQRIVESLITRQAPAIQDFNGFLKVLNPKLSAGDYVLLLLYQRGSSGAMMSELDKWVRQAMRANLLRTLTRLIDVRAFVHFDSVNYYITVTGMQEVERRRLYEIPSYKRQPEGEKGVSV